MLNPEIISCDVSFIKDTTTREMLQDAISAMDNTEGAWSWILDYKPPIDNGFTFSDCELFFASHAWTISHVQGL